MTRQQAANVRRRCAFFAASGVVAACQKDQRTSAIPDSYADGAHSHRNTRGCGGCSGGEFPMLTKLQEQHAAPALALHGSGDQALAQVLTERQTQRHRCQRMLEQQAELRQRLQFSARFWAQAR